MWCWIKTLGTSWEAVLYLHPVFTVPQLPPTSPGHRLETAVSHNFDIAHSTAEPPSLFKHKFSYKIYTVKGVLLHGLKMHRND